MDARRWVWRLALGGALVGCRSVAAGPPAGLAGTTSEGPTATTVGPTLAPECAQLLAQLRCWLRAAGNDEARVTEALAAGRSSFEARADARASCERAMVFRRAAVEGAGCGGVSEAPGRLPASAPATCGQGEFFFVRRDGHVSGCHRDCLMTAECPTGSRCESVGSAAGGPIDERFCE